MQNCQKSSYFRKAACYIFLSTLLNTYGSLGRTDLQGYFITQFLIDIPRTTPLNL